MRRPEYGFAGMLGVSLDLSTVPRETVELAPGQKHTVLLFSKSASRFLLEVVPEQQAAFERHMHAFGVQVLARIGHVSDTGRFVVSDSEQVLIDLPVEALQAAWKGERA